MICFPFSTFPLLHVVGTTAILVSCLVFIPGGAFFHGLQGRHRVSLLRGAYLGIMCNMGMISLMMSAKARETKGILGYAPLGNFKNLSSLECNLE